VTGNVENNDTDNWEREREREREANTTYLGV